MGQLRMHLQDIALSKTVHHVPGCVLCNLDITVPLSRSLQGNMLDCYIMTCY
jgi:hypothetical protein